MNNIILNSFFHMRDTSWSILVLGLKWDVSPIIQSDGVTPFVTVFSLLRIQSLFPKIISAVIVIGLIVEKEYVLGVQSQWCLPGLRFSRSTMNVCVT